MKVTAIFSKEVYTSIVSMFEKIIQNIDETMETMQPDAKILENRCEYHTYTCGGSYFFSENGKFMFEGSRRSFRDGNCFFRMNDEGIFFTITGEDRNFIKGFSNWKIQLSLGKIGEYVSKNTLIVNQGKNGFPEMENPTIEKIVGGKELLDIYGKISRLIRMEICRSGKDSNFFQKFELVKHDINKWSVCLYDPSEHLKELVSKIDRDSQYNIPLFNAVNEFKKIAEPIFE